MYLWLHSHRIFLPSFFLSGTHRPDEKCHWAGDDRAAPDILREKATAHAEDVFHSAEGKVGGAQKTIIGTVSGCVLRVQCIRSVVTNRLG